MNYSAPILHYFEQTPHAGSLLGPKIRVGEAVSSSNTDSIRFFVQIENEELTMIRFQASGSVATIACAEFLAEYCESKSIVEFEKVSVEVFKQALDLPSLKIPSALLAISALKKAVYEGK